MRKILLTLCTFALLTACDNNEKQVLTPEAEKPVSKTVEFTIVPASDYTQPYYNNSTAEVKLSVYKQFSAPFSQDIIWDTVFQRQTLKEYMSLGNSYVIRKTFPALVDSKHKLGAGYSIEYITAPMFYKSWSAFGAVADNGNTTFKVQVSL